MLTKNKYLYLLCFCLIFISGCWDVVNIEDRGFVIGSAIDIDEGVKLKHPEFVITNQIVVPAGMISSSQEVNGGEGGQAFINFTSKGTSIYKMEENVAALSSKVPYYEHLAILAIGENVAKTEHLLSNLLDTYLRDVNLRRGVMVVISEGKAKELFEFITPIYKLPARHIEEVIEKGSNQAGLLKPEALGDIEEFHFRENSYVLPYLTVNDYLAYNHGAVFHGPEDKMVGIFNDEEMQGLGMVKGEHTAKIVEFLYKDALFAIEVIRLRSKVVVDPTDVNDIKVSFNIDIDGVIKESFTKEDITQSSEIKNIQKAVSNKIKQSIEQVIKRAQGEFGTDVFGIWQQLETKHYNLWEQVKNDWEEGENYFKKVSFDVNVTSEIYSTGGINKTK